MKIGNLYITWRTPQKRIHESQVIKNYLRNPEGRELTARIARSEVKNYLAELAEAADLPFGNPADFLKGVGRLALEAGEFPDDRGSEPKTTIWHCMGCGNDYEVPADPAAVPYCDVCDPMNQPIYQAVDRARPYVMDPARRPVCVYTSGCRFDGGCVGACTYASRPEPLPPSADVDWVEQIAPTRPDGHTDTCTCADKEENRIIRGDN